MNDDWFKIIERFAGFIFLAAIIGGFGVAGVIIWAIIKIVNSVF